MGGKPKQRGRQSHREKKLIKQRKPLGGRTETRVNVAELCPQRN